VSWVLLALVVSGTPPSALEAAHASGDPAHVLSVFRTDSAIEDLNSGKVTVFGTRRAYRCPGGAPVSETACDPCTFAADTWVTHPLGVWIDELTFSNDAEHEAAARALAHFSRYFTLTPVPGGESGDGVRHLFFVFGGPRAPPPPPRVAKLQLSVGDTVCDAAKLPYGQRSMVITAVALSKNASGALAPMRAADIAFSGACATLRPTAPGKVLAGLAPGFNQCDLTVTGEPGGARARFRLERALDLQILFQDQAADEIRVQRSGEVDLTYRATADAREVEIHPQWKGEHGTFEIQEAGKRVRFTLDRGARSGSVELVDGRSGARDVISVVRTP